MIKGKPSFPFQKIALAIAFSPRLNALLAEANRYQKLFDSKLILIHVGKKTADKERILQVAVADLKINVSQIIWQDGNAIESILTICKNNIVDLLIIGALEKENILKYYLGSISRELSRKAKCSVLLIIDPKNKPNSINNIVVNGHEHAKTIHTINTAFYFAQKENINSITLIDEIELPVFTMSIADDSTFSETKIIKQNVIENEDNRLNEMLSKCDYKGVELKIKKVKGRTGYTISKHALDLQADLLVVNSPDHHLTIFDRIFSHDLEYLLSELPCNMMIVHSRIPV